MDAILQTERKTRDGENGYFGITPMPPSIWMINSISPENVCPQDLLRSCCDSIGFKLKYTLNLNGTTERFVLIKASLDNCTFYLFSFRIGSGSYRGYGDSDHTYTEASIG